jgi:hypothetical protein
MKIQTWNKAMKKISEDLEQKGLELVALSAVDNNEALDVSMLCTNGDEVVSWRCTFFHSEATEDAWSGFWGGNYNENALSGYADRSKRNAKQVGQIVERKCR